MLSRVGGKLPYLVFDIDVTKLISQSLFQWQVPFPKVPVQTLVAFLESERMVLDADWKAVEH